MRPEVRVVAVQTVDSDSMAQSLQAGQPVALDDVGLFCDGTAVKRVGDETLRLARRCIDEVVYVTTDQVCAAIKDVFLDTRSILEPSGAMSIAGVRSCVSAAWGRPDRDRRRSRPRRTCSGATCRGRPSSVSRAAPT